MSALTSLLVRDQVVPVRKIEEAIQRQVISGGEIEEVLLDMGAIAENVMSAYRAALFGLLPATRDEVMTVSRETIRAVPREVASQYGLLPLSAEERTLVVAVSSPLSPEAGEQLAFLLGHDLVFRIVNHVRLQAALGHHYGIELSARTRRIADKLRSREPGNVPYVAPPQDGKLESSRPEMPSKGMKIEWDDEEPEGRRSDTAKFGSPGGVAPDPDPAPRAVERPTPAERPVKISSGPPVADAEPPEAPAGVAAVVGVGSDEAGGAAARDPAGAEPAPEVRTGAPASRRPVPAGQRPGSERPTRKERYVLPRGPVSAKDAVEALARAERRDDILEILFVFARQFFDFTALFVVHDDIAEGREAHGSGPSREEVSRIAVPLDVPGTFGEVRRNLETRVVDLNDSELDRIVCQDLQREECQPAILFPITIRGRAVLLLYGDQGGLPFGAADVPELVGLLPRVGEAFERIIVNRKFAGYGEGEKDQRSSLKSAVTRVASIPAPPQPKPRGGEYESTTAVGAAPGKEEPPKGRRVRRRKRSAPLDVLGVPRSAPPPPLDPSAPLMKAALTDGVEGVPKTTRPDGQAALAQAALQTLDEPGHPEEEVTIDYSEEDDDLPELGIPAPADRPPASATRAAPREDSSYILRDAGKDVVPSERPAAVREGRDKFRRRPHRHIDARREEDGSSHAHDVVRLPSAHPAPEVIVDVESAADEEHGHVEPRSVPTLPGGEMPSVIVDMGAAIEELVDNLVRCGPDDESSAVSQMLSVGEAVLPVLVQRFPGPLWFDRRRPHRRLPRGRDISGIARAIVAFRERAISYVASLLSARDDDTRFYAVLLSSEFVSLELLDPLSQRVFDLDPGTRLLVLDVMRHYKRYPKRFEEMMKSIRVEARVNRRDAARRRVATRALGELRDVKALPLLVELLTSDDHDLVITAHRALVTLTRQDFGETPKRWAQWVERNGALHRIEWLIESLTHVDDAIRAAAAEELKSITQEYYGYHPASPKRDREIAQKKYRRWWNGEGQKRFA